MQDNYKIKFGIREKVLTILLSILLTAITVSGWFALKEEKQNYLNEINQRGQDISRYVAKSLSFSIIGYDYHTIQLLLDSIVSSDEVKYVEVFNKRKKSMAKAGEFSPQDSGNLIIFKESIHFEDDLVGSLTMALSTEKAIQRMEKQKFSLVTREALIIFLIALGEFIALSFIIINPVKTITKSISNAVDESGQVNANIPITSNDEFGQLAFQFNKLGTQLNRANNQLQRKIEVADEKLIETNKQLLKQAEELKRMNKEFLQLSITDGLTGLYNRRHYEELIKVEMGLSQRHGDPNSILLLDIDHFKSVNDTYGHIAGDIVLKAVAKCMLKNIRKTDVLCRVGGEEFVVICKRVDKENLVTVANKLRVAIENLLIPLNGQMVKVTISIGGATISGKTANTTIDELYRQADNALYYCKEHGRNKYIHYLDMRLK